MNQAGPAASGQLDSESMLVSVILLNYNAASWLPRCIESLTQQTIFSRTQIIIADNNSTDGSDVLSQQLLAGIPNSLFIQNGCNPGFGGGCNLAEKRATGRYLLFLNPDVWLEKDCLENLCNAAEKAKAGAAGVLVLNYDDDSLQSCGALGFDFFAHGVLPKPGHAPEELFAGNGFAFVRRDVFERIGGYDENYFLYCEEFDISWRIWIAGERIIYAPNGRIHHRGAVAVNPEGGTKRVEFRTSDSKRFYSTRNHMLTLLKNGQHLMLLLLVPSVCLLIVEGLAVSLLLRRWSYFSQTVWAAIAGCWRMRRHIRAERKRIRSFRKRGDSWMLRFFYFRFGRLGEYMRLFREGVPKVDNR